MRHVVGFFVGLLLAPVVLVGAGWAQPRLADLKGAGGSFTQADGLVTVAALCALALVVGIAAVAPRLTPLLPGVAGLSLLGASAVAVVRPALAERVPGFVPGTEGALLLAQLGVFLPVAVVLVIPLLVPSRWVSDDPAGVTEEEYFDGLYDEDYEEDPAPAPRGRRRHAA
ncbi:hypothetical protein [Nocardiopsis composta]|uniref:hypothetical protein n=1 Tax=Nocardiopsis composta TaxID=157465 RepID=UPI00161D1632